MCGSTFWSKEMNPRKSLQTLLSEAIKASVAGATR